MKVLYINSVTDFGSTGKIVSDLASISSVDSLIVYGRKESSKTNSYKISNSLNTIYSMVSTILFNDETLIDKNSTARLIEKIKEFKPDIIHLHNIHGYYLNYDKLFSYLNTTNIKVVWTFHDCWPITGYCPYFDLANCNKYKNGCKNCPIHFSYPYSIFKQNISKHYDLKNKLFNLNKNLTIVTPSKWLSSIVKESYLKDKDIRVINNGIDLSKFKSTKEKNKDFSIVFVANYWTKSKGIDELEKIIKNIDKDIKVTIVGSLKATSYLNDRCSLISRTSSVEELVDIYSSSHLFINPTLEENLPTVNIEALACGTPVITYNTGGSPEIIDKKTGKVIDKYDYVSMANEINKEHKNYTYKVDDCVNRSKLFSKEIMQENYLKLYKELLNNI